MTDVRRITKTVPPLYLELLPEILNEVTLNQIITKLPLWRDVHILSSVSHGWLQAIRSHQVYDARVGSHSTETLAVVDHKINSELRRISLYSVRDERLYELPPIPYLGRIPYGSPCISLDSKLYVLGGLTDFKWELASDEVYVLDLAGQRRWRKCASMKQPRFLFGCGIMNGKIYVCGGISLFEPVGGAEIYDPEVNAWSPSPPPMKSMRFDHCVETFGDSIVVHSGNIFHPDYLDWKDERYVDERQRVRSLDGIVQGALWDYYDQDDNSWEVYQPVKEEWQSYPSTMPNELMFTDRQLMFTERGIYLITWREVYINDGNGQDGWTHLHSLSSESSVKPSEADSVMPFSAVVVDGELLTVVHWENSSGDDKSCLVRSRGFCSEKKEIVWQNAHWSGFDKHVPVDLISVMCTVRL